MTTAPAAAERDPYHPDRAWGAPLGLGPWNEAGVLTAGDIHVASTLARLGRQADPLVALGVAFTVRALRMGHVCIELTSLAETATTDRDGPVDLDSLPWPAPDEWMARLATSPLIALGDDAPAPRPLRLVGSRLYLDRYWQQERDVAAELSARWGRDTPALDAPLLEDGLRRLFPPDHDQPAAGDDPQVLAASAALRRWFAVVAGGPGTGKTTTIARIVALLLEQAAATGQAPVRVALAAPTGRAAARLEEAIQREASTMDVQPAVADAVRDLRASTLHRLLGWRPDSHSRFRYDADNRLPHGAVIVDETSMVSLSLMAKLLAALRADCRMILVGDPQQLASVEAGAVLGDIVGPLAAPRSSPATTAPASPAASRAQRGIVVLRRVHRFGGEIAALADAVSNGDEEAVIGLLRAAAPPSTGTPTLRWIDPGPAEHFDEASLAAVRAAVVGAASALTVAARAGAGRRALELVTVSRVLCAHREGPYGAAAWTERVERWLRDAIGGYGEDGLWYAGRPVLVTRNNYELQLYNGDTGVVVRRPDETRTVVFERRGGLHEVSPSQLDAVETLHASTVHRAQGAQFDTVTVVLPEASSPILTRELLYTAVTRARRQVTVVGEEASVRAALRRPIGRASGLGDRLWAPLQEASDWPTNRSSNGTRK